jgi:hypothetical protein
MKMLDTICWKILFALGFIWASPMTLLSCIFFNLPMLIFTNTFESVKWRWREDFAITWDVANESKFFKKAMDGWWGFVFGANIVVVDMPEKYTEPRQPRYIAALKHELMHVYQCYIFGILTIPIYGLNSIGIWLFTKKHAHADNIMEIWARKYAGQKVDRPPETWRDGPNDRWPWW